MDERKEIINRIISDQRQDGMLVEMANIRVDRQRNISIQINRREGLNAFYFKFYNHQDYERADKVCRISQTPRRGSSRAEDPGEETPQGHDF